MATYPEKFEVKVKINSKLLDDHDEEDKVTNFLHSSAPDRIAALQDDYLATTTTTTTR